MIKCERMIVYGLSMIRVGVVYDQRKCMIVYDTRI